MKTTSTTSPGKVPATSLDETKPTEDSMIDVWAEYLRRGDDVRDVMASMWSWVQ